MFEKVDMNVNFSKQELKILDFWKKNKIFEKSVESRSPEREFVFYDGPPFATGLPHYGHFVPGTIKDVIPRYKTMLGYRVERRFGWDCHGLPVENEMKKELGISSRAEIEQYGIDKYNEKCRSIVLRYTAQWKEQIERLGRWVDFDNCYRTMDPDYMESIWWVFKTMYDKGLIYEGYNILPYSPQLGCPLSNFELNLGGYKEVSDPAVTVRFKKEGEEGVYFLAWTTTPWTLPSNLALAVGPEIDYVKVKDKESGDVYILSENRISSYYKSADEYSIVDKFKGNSMDGMFYEPIFPYFAKLRQKGAFRVISAEYVTDTDGTGIVHTASGFGEDDYKTLKRFSEIPVVCPVDESCCFTEEVSDYKGMFVKDADKPIIERLKKERKLIKRENYVHSYPFCYRTGAPIIYRATSCYFVDVPKLHEQMIKANEDINWIPSHLKYGRFGKWIEGAREWAISRNRYWGNPLPIWKSESGKYIEVIGSRAELEEKCKEKVEDLHKHFIDKLTWKAPDGTTMRRIPDILDCWFESGSMPYAQVHYPFENKEKFERNFPADFISEGLDQTRGWFYTLFVNAVALFGKSSYKNVVTNGIVLNADGKKMSKSLRNFTNPMEVVDMYGADAMRFALMHSGATRAEDLKFSDELVRDSIKLLILPLWNAYSFFVTYSNIDKFEAKEEYQKPFNAKNTVDRFIISRVQRLIKNSRKELDNYMIENATNELLSFIDDLNNWYIRQSRRRFWKNGNDADKQEAYRTLYYAIMSFIKVACIFIPFVTETIYQNLKCKGDEESIHLCEYPEADENFEDEALEKETSLVQTVLSMSRRLRREKSLRVRQPLSEIFIVSSNQNSLDILKRQKDVIAEEVNVKKVTFSDDETRLVEYSAKANFKILGPKYGADMKNIASIISDKKIFDDKKIANIIKGGAETIEVSGKKIDITEQDIVVERIEKENVFVTSEDEITVALDSKLTEDLILEGYARDLVREIQNIRKESGLEVSDYITLYVDGDEKAKKIIDKFSSYISRETLAKKIVQKKTKGSKKIECDYEIYVKTEKACKKRFFIF